MLMTFSYISPTLRFCLFPLAYPVWKNSGSSLYKLNLQKNEVFPLNPTALNIPASMFPFRRVTSHFNLGITVPHFFHLLYKLNFSPLIDKCKRDMESWHTSPLSMTGCICLLNMNIPILISLEQFSTLDRIFFLTLSGVAGSLGYTRPSYKDPKHWGGWLCPIFSIITGQVTSRRLLCMSKVAHLSMHQNR